MSSATLTPRTRDGMSRESTCSLTSMNTKLTYSSLARSHGTSASSAAATSSAPSARWASVRPNTSPTAELLY